jgi:hypothetical protein
VGAAGVAQGVGPEFKPQHFKDNLYDKKIIKTTIYVEH